VLKEVSPVGPRLLKEVSSVESHLSKEVSLVESRLLKEVSSVQPRLIKEVSPLESRLLKEVSSVEPRLKVAENRARELGGKVIVGRNVSPEMGRLLNVSPENGAASQGGGVGHSGAEGVAEGAGLVERFVL